MSTVDTETLMRQHLASLEPEVVEIIDESALHVGHAGAGAGGGHYQLTIVSKHFAGLDALGRHRLVYQALEGLMGSRIHALSIQAYAPGEL